MLTQKQLKEALSYDPETGIFLWKQRSDRDQKWNGKFAGKKAGSIHKTLGYVMIGWRENGKDKHYYGHRLAWLYIHGIWPSEIDHINGVREDNKISNLRLATSSQNKYNIRMRKDNSSGFKGVIYCKNRKAKKKWQVSISVNKKRVYHRYFDTPEEAAYFRNYAAEYHHGPYARAA